MFNKLFCLLFVLSFVFISSVYNNICSPQLVSSVKQIEKVPEGQQLLAAIQREGPLNFSVLKSEATDAFGAAWDRETRTIYINLTQHPTRDSIIASLLFELHNASTDSKYNHLNYLASTGQIDKKNYVRSMEYVEYENSLKTAVLADKGIAMGLFSREARLPIYGSFEEHFHYQKIGGHSAWMAMAYDEIAPKNRLRG